MGEEKDVRKALTGLETPPSHVFYSAALWLARLTSAEYLAKLEPGLKAIQELAPNAHTVIRGSAGVVQASAYQSVPFFLDLVIASDERFFAIPLDISSMLRSYRRSTIPTRTSQRGSTRSYASSILFSSLSSGLSFLIARQEKVTLLTRFDTLSTTSSHDVVPIVRLL